MYPCLDIFIIPNLKRLNIMTQNQFILLCNELLIEPSIALENDNIVQALRDRKPIETIKTILQTEF
jgi:hypothetical protein